MKSIKIFWLIILVPVFCACSSDWKNSEEVGRLPVIFPDYTETVIPPNIAPMNFKIREEGKEFMAVLTSAGNRTITVKSTSGTIIFPDGQWHQLLEKAGGKEISIEIFVRANRGNWKKFRPIINRVANDRIDNHLVYRLINTGYVMWSAMGIYQRNLENFDESAVIDNRSIDNTCLNCHWFGNNSPKNMMVHIRSKHAGTLIYNDGKLKKINLKTKFTLSPGGYPNWAPDGKHIAYSVNAINQSFYSQDIRIEVSDAASDLMVYNIEKNTVSTSPQVSTNNRENLPVWSADGKLIYYISAPPANDHESRAFARYSLVRVPFDLANDTWGQPDTVISSATTGKSITFPKTSPDGKYLMFTMTDHGYFSIHHPDADLYLLDLQTGTYEKMDINSPMTDSYHSWSSSGRWFVFSSKRIDGLFTRPFFSYFDQNGKASKPFVLPQKDPEFYDSFLKNYNIPQLITGPVEPSVFDLRSLILSDAQPAKLDASVDTTYMSNHLKKK